jgi:hypothetical protein
MNSFDRRRCLSKGQPRSLWLVVALSTLLLESSCNLHAPQKCTQDVVQENNPKIFLQSLNNDFTPEEGKDKRMIYRCTVPPIDGDLSTAMTRPVLVLHEYDHLSIACLDFAKRLSRAGFTVYLPVLFGKADGEVGLRTTLRTTLALSPDWHALFGEHQRQPITDWLALVWKNSPIPPSSSTANSKPVRLPAPVP